MSTHVLIKTHCGELANCLGQQQQHFDLPPYYLMQHNQYTLQDNPSGGNAKYSINCNTDYPNPNLLVPHRRSILIQLAALWDTGRRFLYGEPRGGGNSFLRGVKGLRAVKDGSASAAVLSIDWSCEGEGCGL
ncbi:MAG: hypothetical protein Q9175_004590 [Cornicularia normoerica]